ncbi:DUF1674 domain-containing protein [Pleomorphomonas diazotrophica]|uniref:DUF1674 domain-containing protein n=1 Tax=Pleomorphomonas diazotrophica TaxID=1166257 RepID=A0A1I4RWG0_9HYPH|nr:DUF1674 domain-containing protein [Pleomorphomonas diazotrophica]PKR88004.1 DUF1674 domain-containing protein [Pleomorphomonas diazotrophica]SFM56539.1 hypothetical protein SAMN05192571_102303 [Pleomorphomonas diazotrophica]
MTDTPEKPSSASEKMLSPAAQRALAEAEGRRRAMNESRPKEIGGRGGLEPARYGDWEVKGIAADF